MFRRKLFFFFLLPTCIFSQGTWVQKANLPGAPRLAAFVAFEINNKGYLGTGHDAVSYFDDFWEYDPAANSWAQKANFGGGQTTFAIGFSIGNKGYGGISTSYTNELWEYDPATNLWTQKANMPGALRSNACTFSLGGKGYVCTGYGGSFLQDVWEYNPISNSWTQKTSLPALGRSDVDRSPFVIGNKAYIGTGFYVDTINFNFITLNDFWEYNPSTNSWTQKANFPGFPRVGATGFSLCGRGFLGLGTGIDTAFNIFLYNDFWVYDPATNNWSSAITFPGGARVDAVAWVLNGKAYLGTGVGNILYNDLWEFTPPAGGNIIASISSSATAICAGQSVTLTASGGSSYVWNTGSTNNTIVVSPSFTTIYSVIASDVCGSDGASINITVTPYNVFISGNAGICPGDTATLTANGGTTFSWSTGDTTSSITVSPTSSAIYSVIVSNGVCTGTAVTTVMVVQQSIASFTYQYDLCKNNCVKFIDQSSGAFNWCWNMGDGGNAFVQNPCWQYSSSATYNPSLIINCNSSCSDTFSLTVPYEVHDTSVFVFIPNAFSPNEDGENDVLNFQIVDNYCVKEFYISIYDRWGEKVFETSDITDVWDGIFNGSKLNAGVYVYYCRTTSEGGSQTFRKGNVTMLR